MKSRYAPTGRALIFWTLFIGLGAVAGALGMLLDPSGRAAHSASGGAGGTG